MIIKWLAVYVLLHNCYFLVHLYLHFNGSFPDERALASALGFSTCSVSKGEPVAISGTDFCGLEAVIFQ